MGEVLADYALPYYYSYKRNWGSTISLYREGAYSSRGRPQKSRGSAGPAEHHAHILISAVGSLLEPKLPHIKRLKNSKGKIVPSAAWDPSPDLRGGRILLFLAMAVCVLLQAILIPDAMFDLAHHVLATDTQIVPAIMPYVASKAHVSQRVNSVL
ncbi:hypothetical protein HYPSUDRAFT_899539 [Hypholoma sublateritium FD-334 SS-4]|uniref:Uncharacterized protein n=1 Tax=Hypholoma sublateritium (strain FD-334 SS-4) TaxID=945553 RepID=A0A0D2NK23_HYPSF|nr:hypothetical protein HYPSUDRAFT_899539 [Hypholoma sublateritium FD-334 SS-4]